MSAEVKGRALGMRLKYSESRKLTAQGFMPHLLVSIYWGASQLTQKYMQAPRQFVQRQYLPLPPVLRGMGLHGSKSVNPPEGSGNQVKPMLTTSEKNFKKSKVREAIDIDLRSTTQNNINLLGLHK